MLSMCMLPMIMPSTSAKLHEKILALLAAGLTRRDGSNLATQASISPCFTSYRGEMTPHLFNLHQHSTQHHIFRQCRLAFARYAGVLMQAPRTMWVAAHNIEMACSSLAAHTFR